jgi:alanine racemase
VSPNRTQASVNVAAIERNCARLRSELGAGVELCAVVKADGYGHGATQTGCAALAGGASWLAVASSQEALGLRRAGIEETRVLVMGALTGLELEEALAAGADVVAWHESCVEAVAAAGGGRVHVKFDSGMGRLGTRDAAEASRVIAAARETAGVEAVGAMTHFATADEDSAFLADQLARFDEFAHELRGRHPGILVHAANSAATLREPASHYDMVRCGIAIYGCDPMNENPDRHGLEPALELSSYVAAVKRAQVGDSAGYGRQFVAQRDTWIATLPIGYADGVRRALSNNCDVLVGGARHPLVGRVSMDNITIDLGSATSIHPGQAATIIGSDDGQRQTAEDLAQRIGTINYEIVCGISGRVPRSYHRDGEPL